MPNGAYLHVLINHVPVILAPIGAFAVILAWLTGRRGVWLYALATLTLAGISAYPVSATGDLAEDVVVHTVAGVSRAAIHAHEESADLALWLLLGAGIVAAYGWWRLVRAPEHTPKTVLPAWLRVFTLLLSLCAAGAVTVASEKAGYIIHHEIHVTE